MTPEQKARDMLERMGVEGAQSFSAGQLVELANLINDASALERWKADGEKMISSGAGPSALFALGGWWADRPWRDRPATEQQPKWDPIFKEDGKSYMRYDRIDIRRDYGNDFTVRFYWKGKLTYTQEVPGCKLEEGQLLTLSGLDGRVEFNLTKAS